LVRAVVLVKSPLTLTASQVGRIRGVKMAFDVTGRFDSVALVEVSDAAKLRKTIFEIQGIRGVKKTETMVEL